MSKIKRKDISFSSVILRELDVKSILTDIENDIEMLTWCNEDIAFKEINMDELMNCINETVIWWFRLFSKEQGK